MEKMLAQAIEAIKASSKESSVYVGCDSKRLKKKGKWVARYATVVIVHKDSRHGCNLFFHEEWHPDFSGRKAENVKQRLLKECELAVQAAVAVSEHLDGRYMEVHIDVNPNPVYKSNVAVKEALGWCTGMGFNTKIKPQAWAAMHAADHIANGKRDHIKSDTFS